MQWLTGILHQLSQAAMDGATDLGLVVLIGAAVIYYAGGRITALVTGCVACVFMVGAQPILNGIKSIVH